MSSNMARSDWVVRLISRRSPIAIAAWLCLLGYACLVRPDPPVPTLQMSPQPEFSSSFPNASVVSIPTPAEQAVIGNGYCDGAVSPPQYFDFEGQEAKYVVFYPNGGVGNGLMGYVSAAIFACLTGRQLRIAPPSMRQKNFKCVDYFDTGPGSLCHSLEMPEWMEKRYRRFLKEGRAGIRSPSAWKTDHCEARVEHFQYFLCDNGASNEPFISVSSFQYYGDLFHYNPHFRDRLSVNPFRDILLARLRPSVKVQNKMVHDGPYHVCIHVRNNREETSLELGLDWVHNLNVCVRNVLEGNDGQSKSEVLVFTMHDDVRHIVQNTIEADGIHHVKFASISEPSKIQAHSRDKYQGIGDMFSMATQCVNILPSSPKSTYFLVSANLMQNPRIFPSDRWKEGCRPGSEIVDVRPEGDFWNGEDYCGLKNMECTNNAIR